MNRCSEKAFAMCPTRHLCGTREEATFTDDSECAAFNRAVEEKPMTNAERIRAMSDKELAQWLAEHQCLIAEKVSMIYGIGFICDDMDIQECAKENLTWLQQPATGGDSNAR